MSCEVSCFQERKGATYASGSEAKFTGLKRRRSCVTGLVILLSYRSRLLREGLIAAAGRGQFTFTAEQVLHTPSYEKENRWLKARKQAQIQTLDQFGVFHDFQFSDRVSESGITFKNIVVDDAAKQYKAIHYDHGNGIAAADVDGDGRIDLYFVTQLGSNELWRNLGNGRLRTSQRRLESD